MIGRERNGLTGNPTFANRFKVLRIPIRLVVGRFGDGPGDAIKFCPSLAVLLKRSLGVLSTFPDRMMEYAGAAGNGRRA